VNERLPYFLDTSLEIPSSRPGLVRMVSCERNLMSSVKQLSGHANEIY
jgi:hypothetical protein